VLTRGLDIKAGAAQLKAAREARTEAELVVVLAQRVQLTLSSLPLAGCWRDFAAGLLPITELLAGNPERWRSECAKRTFRRATTDSPHGEQLAAMPGRVDSSGESVVIPKDILIRRA
jgi:hypothetical protein